MLDGIGYWALLRTGVTPTALIKDVRVAETGVKLAREKFFLQWLRFVKKYRLKHGEFSFADSDMLTALRKIMPDDGQLVSLLQSLRKTADMKSHANTMIRFLFMGSPSTRSMMNTRCLDAGEDPAVVFKILSLDDAIFFKEKTSLSQWLDYMTKFRAQNGEQKKRLQTSIDTSLQSLESRPTDEMAALFQSFKATQGMENIASKLQSRVFTNWINSDFDPVHIVKQLKGLPESYFSPSLTYKTTEAFALQYATRNGEKTLKKVEELFAKQETKKALAAAMDEYNDFSDR
ncbi:hypothetical protein V7S43_011463 [Phytophthora oleae]|uniref:RXLR phytopathogen effector protein WY-domain domain-containing protein n=1 Tax=Phytophthora oleae TaxID=2107226 RepID=A0ABD3FAW9_9STRA